MQADAVAAHAAALLRLLQGAVFSDDAATWNLLLAHQEAVRQDFARMGLELYLSEADGFAFLRQPELEGANGQLPALPRLTRRDRLSYHVTLLCALLRERLEQFEAGTPESDRLLLSHDELRDALRPFFPERHDERALTKKLDETVNRVIELGFLKAAGGANDLLEVRRRPQGPPRCAAPGGNQGPARKRRAARGGRRCCLSPNKRKGTACGSKRWKSSIGARSTGASGRSKRAAARRC